MPLFTRGWVVQERVLPRRTLFFTRTEVYWECANLTACERIPTGAPYVLDNRVFLERPVQRNMWDAVVRHYTRCNLTKSRDKLVAISGIARLLYDETHDEYVAGLWRTDLKHQLLWSSAKTLDEFGKSTRPPEYRAPSCSWATIDGPIDTVDWKEGSFKIEIDDLQIKSCVKNNPFGEIESASLRISSQDQLLLGFVQPLKLDTKCSKDESSKEKAAWEYIAFTQDESFCYFGSANLDVSSDLRKEHVRGRTWYGVTILRVMAHAKNRACRNYKITGRSTGLILLRNAGGQYRRIGTCFGYQSRTIKEREWEAEGYFDNTAADSLDLSQEKYYSKICTDKSGKKIYFIDIV